MAASCTQGKCPGGGTCMNDKCIRSTMVTSGVQCRSDHESLGTFDSFYACEQACIDKEGCKYFLYGQPGTNNAKNCYWEKTSSASCPEGFEADTCNFHSLDLSDGVGMVTFDQIGQPGSQQEPSLRTLRDVVDFGFQRGCLEKSFRNSSDTDHGNASDQKVCSMNVYQDFYGGEDLQMRDKDGLLAQEMLGENPSSADWNRLKNQPSWRNYPSGHIGMMWTIAGENVEEGKFHRNTNIARRAGTVAHPKSEYFIAGCIGQPQWDDGDEYDWLAKLRPVADSNADGGPGGFVDYTDQRVDTEKPKPCSQITDKDLCAQTNGCIVNTQSSLWNTEKKGCISGLTSATDSHTFGNVKLEGTGKASNDGGSTGIAQTAEPFFADSASYCKRNTELKGEKFSRQYVRKDSAIGNEYSPDSADADKHSYPPQRPVGEDKDTSLRDYNIERACCLGAGTYMQGQVSKDGYEAAAGKRPLGAPCSKDMDCWDGHPGGTVFCHTEDTKFFRWTDNSANTDNGVKGSTREKHSGASEPWPSDREGPDLDEFNWPASNTCRRRCGVAGKENSRFENIKDEYGASWIGSSYGDSYNINEQRVRSGVGWGIGVGASILFGPLGLVAGAVAIGFTESDNHKLKVSIAKQAKEFLEHSSTNTFECGFQQRWKDKDGEQLYHNPVWERADKHEDSTAGFMCDFDNRECEKITEENRCNTRKIGPGKAKCYWRNGKCSSFVYEYKDCGGAFCRGDEHSSTFMCVKNCGWKKGYEERAGPMWTGGANYPCEDEGCLDEYRRGYMDWEQTTSEGFICYEGPRKYGPSAKLTYTNPGGAACDDPAAQCKEGTTYEQWVHDDVGTCSIAEHKTMEACYDADGTWTLSEKDREVGVGCCLLRHDCSESGIGGSGQTGAPGRGDKHKICPFDYESYRLRGDWDAWWDRVDREDKWDSFKEYTYTIPVGHYPTAWDCKSGQSGGDCSVSIEVADKRCFYPVADGTTCWQPPMRRTPGSSDTSNEDKVYTGDRVMDTGALTEDHGCVPGWSERTAGICTKDCERYYRKEQTVGYGFSHPNCADCAGASNADKNNPNSACRKTCSLTTLSHCAGRSESTCETPAAGELLGCEWKNGSCTDPTVKSELGSNYHWPIGLLCQEGCGIDMDGGPNYYKRKSEAGDPVERELCDDSSKCTQWQAQRCYKHCDRDQVEVGLSGHAYLCRDSCERVLADKAGSCAIKIKSSAGHEYIVRPGGVPLTSEENRVSTMLQSQKIGSCSVGDHTTKDDCKEADGTWTLRQGQCKKDDEFLSGYMRKSTCERDGDGTWELCPANKPFGSETGCREYKESDCDITSVTDEHGSFNMPEELISGTEGCKLKSQERYMTEAAHDMCAATKEGDASEYAACVQRAVAVGKARFALSAEKARETSVSDAEETRGTDEGDNTDGEEYTGDVDDLDADTEDITDQTDAGQEQVDDTVEQTAEDIAEEHEEKEEEWEEEIEEAEDDRDGQQAEQDNRSDGEEAWEDPESLYQTGYGCALPGDKKKPEERYRNRVREVWGVCWEDCPNDCEDCRDDGWESEVALNPDQCDDMSQPCRWNGWTEDLVLTSTSGISTGQTVTQERDGLTTTGRVTKVTSSSNTIAVKLSSCGRDTKATCSTEFDDEHAVKVGSTPFDIKYLGLGYHADGSYRHLTKDPEIRAAAFCAEKHKDSPSGYTGCVDSKAKEFQKDNNGACSCDRGAFCQTDCGTTMPKDLEKYIARAHRRTVTKKKSGWYYTPGICWSQCPDGYYDAGTWCLAGCGALFNMSCKASCSSKKNEKSCTATKLSKTNSDANSDGSAACKWESDKCVPADGSDGTTWNGNKAPSYICKWQEGWDQQGIGGAHWCAAHSTHYGRGWGYAWQFGDELNDKGMKKRCEKEEGKGKCQKCLLMFYPKCKSGYHADGCNICAKDGPWTFTPESAGGHSTKSSWVTTKIKRSFVPATHAKQSYTPKSWGMSTYPMVRVKNSFVPATRTRRAYTTTTRIKDLTSNDAYTIGKARNAWWWDKYSSKGGAEKCCMQGCQDASGTFSDGCVEMKKEPEQTLSKQPKYEYPPLCRTVWTPGIPHVPFDHKNEDMDQVMQKQGGEYTHYTKDTVSAWGQSCAKHFVGEGEKKGWCLEDVVEKTRIALNGMCYYLGAADGDLSLKSPPTDSAISDAEFAQQSESNCKTSFRKRAGKKCGGSNKESVSGVGTYEACLQSCEASSNCRGFEWDGGSSCQLVTSSDFAVRRDPQASTASCSVRGKWTDDLRAAADDMATDSMSDATWLGEVQGWTRQDRRTILMPFFVPRSIDTGDAKRRDIYLTVEDKADVWDGKRWTKRSEHRMFRVAAKSQDYEKVRDRKCEGTVDYASDKGTGVAKEEECRKRCDDRSQCAAYEYDAVGKACKTFKEHVDTYDGTDGITNKTQCSEKCNDMSTCVRSQWTDNDNKCKITTGAAVASMYNETDNTRVGLGTTCAFPMSNPRIARDEDGETIGFDTELEPMTSIPAWWSGSGNSNGSNTLQSDLHLRNDVNELRFGSKIVSLPARAVLHPGDKIRLGRIGTENRFVMKRYQASALHGGDMCRNWMVGVQTDNGIRPAFADGSVIEGSDKDIIRGMGPIMSKMCDEYTEEKPHSILQNALDWCNERVEHTKGALRATAEGKRKYEMLESMPACLTNDYNNFDLPTRACPRWTSAGEAGEFCRKLKNAYPLQYDSKIVEFCEDPVNQLLPACDCLSAEIVASKAASPDKSSPISCNAAVGATKADSYKLRQAFCKTRTLLGEDVFGNVMRQHRGSFHPQCMSGPENKHVLQPVILALPSEDKVQSQAACDNNSNRCGMGGKCAGDGMLRWETKTDCEANGGDWQLSFTCTELPMPPNICANITSISIDNCIQVGTGDSPCASIKNVQQKNTCCKNDCPQLDEDQCRAEEAKNGNKCKWRDGKCKATCIEVNKAQSTINNKITMGMSENRDPNPSRVPAPSGNTWRPAACKDGNGDSVWKDSGGKNMAEATCGAAGHTWHRAQCMDAQGSAVNIMDEQACANVFYQATYNKTFPSDMLGVTGTGGAKDAAEACHSADNCVGFVMEEAMAYRLAVSSEPTENIGLVQAPEFAAYMVAAH